MPPKVHETRSGRGRRQSQVERGASPGFGKFDEKHSPSPSKRQKRGHDSGTSSALRTQIMRPDGMYSFTSNVIDLTSSPDKSPSGSPLQRKTINGVRSSTAATSAAPKKLFVKNFRKTTQSDPEQYYNQVWKQLDDALEAIFSRDVKPFSMEQLYRGVENVCRQERAPQLFGRLKAKCREHVSKTIRSSLISLSEAQTNTQVLASTTEMWANWRRQMTTIRSIFYYMDRSYLLHSANLPSIDELGIALFREHVFQDKNINSSILGGACALVFKARGDASGQGFVPELFKEAVGMFHTLAVYTKNFEPMLLSQSQDYFDEWAQRNSSELSLAAYVDQCHAMFRKEIDRCDAFALDESTKRNLNSQMDTHLVFDQQQRLTNIVDVVELMDENNLTALKSLYQLLEKKGLGEKLKAPFEEYIDSDGTSIVFDEKRQSEMVIRLLQFKQKLDLMWETSFTKNQALGHCLREAFESFINKTKKTNMTWGTDNDKPGEMIAKYADLILRGGSKAIPDSVASQTPPAAGNEEEMDENDVDEDSQINRQLEQVLDLFRFVHGKAVFEAFYKKDLAKRLLMNRSASADAEKSMLDKLKQECGSGFTQNLETMFKDIELAREENTSYRDMLVETERSAPVDLNVNVLSAAAWPTYPDVQVEVPRDIQKASVDYERYYKLKHTGRKLTWKHSLAHCQMRAHFDGGDKELIVSSFQAIVLLYFNEKAGSEPVTYAELSQATKLPEDELKRTLQSLACAKYRVLTKSPKGKNVETTDRFIVNRAFTDQRSRIKINTIQLKETKEENKQTHERVAADRQYETQAAIVRIMKGEKRIKHALLVAKVIDALKSRGAVNADDIKKQIEKLIDKDYMEREDNGEYSYIS